MRLAVTAVSPATRQQADVVIDADPAMPVAEVAAEIDRLMHGEVAAAGRGARALRPPRARAARYAGPGIPGYGPATAPAVTGPAIPALFVGGHRVPGDLRLADSPVTDGCVVSLGDPAGCRRPDPTGVAELRVAGGPAAGALHRLQFGQVDVGGLAPAQALVAGMPDIVIGDPAIPPVALRVFVDAQGCQVAPFDGARAWLDRQPLDSAAPWEPGNR
jgi:S-DNA-T family DNA segregation ATPase FtsK/SpoIIIE